MNVEKRIAGTENFVVVVDIGQILARMRTETVDRL